MKKRTIFLLLWAMGTGSLFAQKGFNIQFAIQPGASFIIGDWKVQLGLSDDAYSFVKSFTFGFDAGLAGGYNFTDNLGASVGLYYSLGGQNYKGISIPVGSSTATVENDISLSYIKIPVKFNFNTNPTKSVSFSGFAGFYLGFLAGYKQTYNLTSPDFDQTIVYKGKTMTENGSEQYDLIGKPFKSTDFGITLGAGLQTKLSEKLFLQIMLNYQLGLGDIKNVSSQIRYSDSDLGNVYPPDDPNRSISHKNSVLGLMIGLKKSF